MSEEATRRAWRLRAREVPDATTSGMLLAGAMVPVAIVEGVAGSALEAPRWLMLLGAADVMVLLLAAAAIPRAHRAGRVLASVGLLGGLGLSIPMLAKSPEAALAALVTITVLLALLWKVGAPLIELSRMRRRPIHEGQAQGAAIVGATLWLLLVLFDQRNSGADTVAAGWALFVGVLLSVDWALRSLAAHRRRALWILGLVGLSLVLAGAQWGHWWWTVSPLAIAALGGAFLIRRRPASEFEQSSLWDPLLGHPQRLFVGTFAGLSFLGSVLLALPQSSASGEGIGFVDALFMATSAVCVTGLSVVDTGTEFSRFGQGVILLLVQVGGLGIMTFSTAAVWAMGRRMSLRHEGAVASLISTQDRGRLFATAKLIIKVTFALEAVGALLLTLAFLAHGDGVGMALWRGVFTAISAFCNAGITLQSDSLMSYQGAPLVLHTVAALGILGALSPFTVLALPVIIRRAPAPVTAQARLGLTTSLILLGGSFLYFLTFEWSAALGDLSIAEKLNNAWLQSAVLRSSGFHSVDITGVRPATLTLMLVWMFIGGSPGSTGGGIKTTTLAVLVLSVVRAVRGQWTIEVFGKRIPERTVTKAAVITVVAVMVATGALVTLQLTQQLPTRLAVFEVISALGTTGLSLGGTELLDGVGKLVILVCMFTGRVGGLTLLMFLSSRQPQPLLGRPEEAIDVG